MLIFRQIYIKGPIEENTSYLIYWINYVVTNNYGKEYLMD